MYELHDKLYCVNYVYRQFRDARVNYTDLCSYKDCSIHYFP